MQANVVPMGCFVAARASRFSAWMHSRGARIEASVDRFVRELSGHPTRCGEPPSMVSRLVSGSVWADVALRCSV